MHEGGTSDEGKATGRTRVWHVWDTRGQGMIMASTLVYPSRLRSPVPMNSDAAMRIGRRPGMTNCNKAVMRLVPLIEYWP
eukprot:1182777-Prorocentrum_minimum.AAC.5